MLQSFIIFYTSFFVKWPIANPDNTKIIMVNIHRIKKEIVVLQPFHTSFSPFLLLRSVTMEKNESELKAKSLSNTQDATSHLRSVLLLSSQSFNPRIIRDATRQKLYCLLRLLKFQSTHHTRCDS